MMLYGKSNLIRVCFAILLMLSFLIFACCNKKSIENQKLTTKEETKQQVAGTSEKQNDKTSAKATEKEISSTQKPEIITTVANNSTDNEIVFDAMQEDVSINTSSTKISAISTTEVSKKPNQTTNEPASKSTQTVTIPATDSDGWVTKWY